MRTALLASLLLAGCSSVDSDFRTKSLTYVLVRLDLDSGALANAGHTPLFRDLGSAGFGQEPRAMGSFRTTAQGKAAMDVIVREPVVGIGGRRSVVEHSLIHFLGTLDEEGRTVAPLDGDQSGVAPGRPTVLHITHLSKTRISVQAASGGNPLPYVFVFDSTPIQPPAVRVPMVP
jgi:hypothetical protein